MIRRPRASDLAAAWPAAARNFGPVTDAGPGRVKPLNRDSPDRERGAAPEPGPGTVTVSPY
eukprot:751273-Hanusia_phi.AAC.1